jgi:putative oxidoreductase
MTPRKDKFLIQSICTLFIFLFVYTAVSKFYSFTSFRYVLSKSPLIGSLKDDIAWAIPITELLIAGLLLLPRTKLLGLFASFVLMSTFTLYLVYMILFTADLPCSCGGIIGRLGWGTHLALNIILTFLSLTGIRTYRKQMRASIGAFEKIDVAIT